MLPCSHYLLFVVLCFHAHTSSAARLAVGLAGDNALTGEPDGDDGTAATLEAQPVVDEQADKVAAKEVEEEQQQEEQLAAPADTSHLKLKEEQETAKKTEEEEEEEEEEEQVEVEEKDEGVNVTVFWLRHGFSCANAMKYTGDLRSRQYDDPPLSDCGMHRAQKLGPQIYKKIQDMVHERGIELLPMVFTSVLSRAQETAIFNFADLEVYPIAYIAEENSNRSISTTVDNVPKPAAEQLEFWSYWKSLPSGSADRVKYVDSINPADHQHRKGKDQSNYNKFLSTFPMILTQVMGEQKQVAVIVVSHSNYMRRHTACGKRLGKARNNEVWVQDYRIEKLPPREAAANWTQLLRSEEADKVDELAQDYGMSEIEGESVSSCEPLFPYKATETGESVSPFPRVPTLMCQEVVTRCEKKPKRAFEDSMKCRNMVKELSPKELLAKGGEQEYLVCGGSDNELSL